MPTPSDPSPTTNDDLLPDYEIDYTKAQLNRFATAQIQTVVLLDPDVAQVFTDSETVNRVLRALITTMPPTP